MPMGVAVTAYVAGDVKHVAHGNIDPGFLACDGSAVSRTAYAALFAVIGTIWGAGDGATTFNVPDLRGRAPIGAGTGTGLTARTVGQSVGEETHLLVTAEMPVHNHAVSDPGHSHGITGYQNTTGGSAGPAYDNGDGGTAINYATNGTATGIGVDNAGGGGAHNNIQPSAVLTFQIKY